MSRAADFLVVGGGVVGLTAALELRRRDPGARIVVLEKEDACGRHASGRNSGVLHAGFYYTADSLKARFTRDGNRELAAWCEARGVTVDRCGKLVVTRDESELEGLEELLRRGRTNGVRVRRVDEDEAAELEPAARTHGAALWSPDTASVDPAEVMEALARDAAGRGIELRTGEAYVGRRGDRVVTESGAIPCGYVVNAAGLHADRVARDFGFAAEHRILPFKGLYLYAPEGEAPLRAHIYPVPELRYPFLGVHFTRTVAGRTKIGPTAIPVPWREQYAGLEGFSLRDLTEIGALGLGLLARDEFGFRRLARRELAKYHRGHLVQLASGLWKGELPDARRWRWGRPGIRAQLVHLPARRLEMDFRVEGGAGSAHVLNAVSPAFTCAFPFARFLVDRIEAWAAGREAAGAATGDAAGAGGGSRPPEAVAAPAPGAS